METNVPVDDLVECNKDLPESPVKDIEKSTENLQPELKEQEMIKESSNVEHIVPPLRKPIPEEQLDRDRNPVTGTGVSMKMHRSRRRSFNANQGGNPILWEGYGEERPGTPQNTGEIGYPSNARRGRVPPGGFSSGLW